MSYKRSNRDMHIATSDCIHTRIVTRRADWIGVDLVINSVTCSVVEYIYTELHLSIISEHQKVAVTQGVILQELLPATIETHRTFWCFSHIDSPWVIWRTFQFQNCSLGQLLQYMCQELSRDSLQETNKKNEQTKISYHGKEFKHASSFNHP